MCSKYFAAALVVFTGFTAAGANAQTTEPQADFLFIGSYHMGNPGRDVHNTKADDVLSEKRQREIAEVVRLIERYRPTKVMVEAATERQDEISTNSPNRVKARAPWPKMRGNNLVSGSPATWGSRPFMPLIGMSWPRSRTKTASTI